MRKKDKINKKKRKKNNTIITNNTITVKNITI